jgi:hypothetical protein
LAVGEGVDQRGNRLGAEDAIERALRHPSERVLHESREERLERARVPDLPQSFSRRPARLPVFALPPEHPDERAGRALVLYRSERPNRRESHLTGRVLERGCQRVDRARVPDELKRSHCGGPYPGALVAEGADQRFGRTRVTKLAECLGSAAADGPPPVPEGFEQPVQVALLLELLDAASREHGRRPTTGRRRS